MRTIETFGDLNMLQPIIKTACEKEGWSKSTKAIQFHHGCLIQVSSRQLNPDGSYMLSEALEFVPDIMIERSVDTIGPHFKELKKC